MVDNLGCSRSNAKDHNVDNVIEQLAIVNDFENSSKVLAACAHNAKLWDSGAGTVASVNLLAGRYNCTTSEISSIVYGLIRLCEIASKKQVNESELESRLCLHGFSSDVAQLIVSFAFNQPLSESLSICRNPTAVFSPYPRFRSIAARTEIKQIFVTELLLWKDLLGVKHCKIAWSLVFVESVLTKENKGAADEDYIECIRTAFDAPVFPSFEYFFNMCNSYLRGVFVRKFVTN